MKKIITFSLLLALASFTFSSCGNKSEEQESLVAPKGMKYVDISKSGMNLYLLSPDSTVGPLDTVYQSWGGYELKVGTDFQIMVIEDNGNIAGKKEDIKNDDVNALKQYVIDDASTLMWESGIGDMSEFHFYHVAKVGDRTYVFEDIKGEAFTKEAVQKMLDACKAVKEKKVAAKEA